MSNAIYASGNVTREVKEAVKPFTLVKLNTDGTISPSDAKTFPYGAVSEEGHPESDNKSVISLYPSVVNVTVDSAIVKLNFTGADSSKLKAGADIFAAADGSVSDKGSVKVGKLHKVLGKDKVAVHIFAPTKAESSSAAAV